MFALAYAVGSPILTTLTVNLPRRELLVAIMVLFGAINILAALAPAFAWLAVARILAGCVAGVYIPAAAATATSIVRPEHRGRALALVTGASSLATVIGVPVGIWIAAEFGWRATFVFVAVLSAAAGAGVAVLLPAIPSAAPVSLRERLGLLRRGDVLTSLAVTTLWMTAGFTIYTYIAPIMQALHQATDETLSWLILVFGAAGALGSWTGGYAVDRVGSTRVLVPALVILTVNFVLIAETATTVLGAVVFMFIWGAAGWGFSPAQQHRLIKLVPAAPPMALSLNASAIYLGIALGAVAGGGALQMVGVRRLGLVAGAFDVIALVLVLQQWAREPRLASEAAAGQAGSAR